jgi:hypothetical protein
VVKKIYKYSSLCLLLLFFSLALDAQATFNKRFHFNYPASVLTNVAATDSCYYATGLVADSLFPHRPGFLFVKLDLDGEVEFAKTITYPDLDLEFWYNTLLPTPDGNFLIAGMEQDSLTRAVLMQINDQGEVLEEKKLFHKSYPDLSFLEPIGLEQTTDGGLVMVSWQESNPYGNTDISIMKLDSAWNEEWHKTYGSYFIDRPKSLVQKSDGTIVVGAYRANLNQTVEDYIFQTWVFGIDSLGQHLWSYVSPIDKLRDGANGLLIEENGDLIIASGIGTEYVYSSVNFVFFEKSIARIQWPGLEVGWEKEFVGNHYSNLTKTIGLTAVENESAFVTAGTAYYSFPDEDGYRQRGWLHKSTYDGDSIWTREYEFLETIDSEHTFYDIQQAPDHGFVLVGEVKDMQFIDTIPQQGWILKVDEYGCLIPGCQLVDVEEVLAPHFELAVYPNPATEYISFQIKSTASLPSSSAVRIIDLNGRVLKSFDEPDENVTYLLSVDHYPGGTYFVQYLEQGQILATQAFIKQ